MESFLYDLKQAARGLVRSPVFTITAVFTLALGIGANTTAFGVLNAILLRPLPFAEPERLVMLWEANEERNRDRNVVSPANFLDWQRQSTAFSGMAAFSDWRTSLTGFGEPEQVPMAYTTPSFFPLLGVRPAFGRVLEPADERAGAPLTVVLSHRLWQRKFGGDSSIVGKTITLGARPRTVVGIMPAGFGFPESKAELWMPLGLDPAIDYRERSGRFLSAFARLRPGVSIAYAQAELSTIAKRLEAEYPVFNAAWGVRAVSMLEDVVGSTRRALIVVACAVALVLLIACANVANLLLVRSSSRSREIAMRAALGAGRARVARLLLLESLVLAIAAGALGLVFATWGTAALSAVAGSLLPRAATIGVDGWVLAFTIALSVLTALIFGSLPAWRTARADLNALVQRGNRQTSQGMRARYALVSAQVAITLVLLIGAGLLGRSFLRLSAVNPGFDADGVLTFRLDLPGARYDTEPKMVAFFESVLREVRALPDVRAASAINWLPLSGLNSRTTVFVEGQPLPPPAERLGADVRAVDAEYFRTMRIPLLKGELLSRQHTAGTPRAIVITATTARTWFGNGDPIGQHILMPWGDTLRGRIVGVVGDVHHSALDSLPRTTVYWALPQFPSSFMSLVVRTSGDPLAVTPALRDAVRRVDPNVPLADLKPMTAYLGDSVARRRFFTTTLGVFAAVALLLAMVGLYGALAFSVTQRTREIGVRVALGAQRDAVLGMVLREGLRVTAFGLAVGAVGALAATQVLSTMLYGVGPRDAATFGLTAVALVGVTLVASYVPARRALAVDPVEALRQE